MSLDAEEIQTRGLTFDSYHFLDAKQKVLLVEGGSVRNILDTHKGKAHIMAAGGLFLPGGMDKIGLEVVRGMLELWGRPNAYNVQKTLWLLAELGLEFRHHDIGSNAGDLDTPEFLALNPHARVPVLKHGEAIIVESNTILRYLASSHGASALYPEDAFVRAQVERWMDWELASLQPAFISLFWGFYRTPPASREQAGMPCKMWPAVMSCQLSLWVARWIGPREERRRQN